VKPLIEIIRASNPKILAEIPYPDFENDGYESKGGEYIGGWLVRKQWSCTSAVAPKDQYVLLFNVITTTDLGFHFLQFKIGENERWGCARRGIEALVVPPHQNYGITIRLASQERETRKIKQGLALIYGWNFSRE
jgi:hypothetical protein